MLVIAKSLRELDFRALMDIYEEGNLENGRDRWPGLPVSQQQLQAEQDFYSYLMDTYFTAPGAFYALWQQNGRPVSAVRVEPYRDGWLLEGLETMPDQRGNGYATELVRAVIQHLGSGRLYSHVSRNNGASLAVHRKCGFEKILDHAVYIDGSANVRAVTLCRDCGRI